MKCSLCRHERDEAAMHVITLTPAEKTEIEKMGYKPEERLVYCRPCWRILSDRERGARLLQGMFQVRLSSLGVEDPAKKAEDFYQRLIAKASKQPVS